MRDLLPVRHHVDGLQWHLRPTVHAGGEQRKLHRVLWSRQTQAQNGRSANRPGERRLRATPATHLHSLSAAIGRKRDRLAVLTREWFTRFLAALRRTGCNLLLLKREFANAQPQPPRVATPAQRCW